MNKEKIIIVTDPFFDVDDLVALEIALYLHKKGIIEILLIIANRFNVENAKYVKGLLNFMDLDIKVVCGIETTTKFPDYKDLPFMSCENIEYNYIKELQSVLEQNNNKTISIALQSTAIEISEFINHHNDLFKQKIKSVHFMSAIEVKNNNSDTNDDIKIVPSFYATNNRADCPEKSMLAAQNLIDFTQNNNIDLIITTKTFAYDAKTPLKIYDDIIKITIDDKIKEINKWLKDANIRFVTNMYLTYTITPETMPGFNFEKAYPKYYRDKDGFIIPETIVLYDVFNFLTIVLRDNFYYKKVNKNCFVIESCKTNVNNIIIDLFDLF